jgi:hypothetical protein
MITDHSKPIIDTRAVTLHPTSPRVAAVLARRFPAQHLKAAP